MSDAHGNAGAFDRGVSLLLAEGAERLFFLGDAIGYLPSAEVLDSLAHLGDRVQCIRGNHESMLLEGQLDLAREQVYLLESLRPKLTPRQVKMILNWPSSRRIMIDGLRILLVHGSPADPTYGYVYPETDLTGFAPDADWVFMGNTHHPFIRVHGGTNYVNIGSCGMPRDDGRYGSVALLNTEANSARILRFDITKESKRALEQFPMVHPSVRDLYTRRRSVVTGDIL